MRSLRDAAVLHVGPDLAPIGSPVIVDYGGNNDAFRTGSMLAGSSCWPGAG